MSFIKSLEAALKVCKKLKIETVIVGGLASMYLGSKRATTDGRSSNRYSKIRRY